MKTKQFLATLMTIAFSVTFIAGCTKPRTAKFADDQTAGAMYAVSELQNIKVQVTTEAADQASAQALETKRVKIASTNGSARVNALLVGLEITGQPATQYNLLVTVSSDFLTIFKIVGSEQELTQAERQTAYRNKGQVFAPVAQIKVEAYGVIEREKNGNGEKTSNLVLRSTSFAQASHVKLDTNLDNVMGVDKEYANMLRIFDIKGKEFLFRRTFAKASNTFGAAPGSSGNLEIVRFDLKKDRLSIRKVLHSKGQQNSIEANKEEIMSVSAEYFRRDSTAGGNMPTKLVKTNAEQAEYVQINWSSEKSTYHSPVNWIAANCIQDQSLLIENIDNRMDEGVLSLTKTITANVAPQCATDFSGGAYDTEDHEQRNFELQERISFRAFDPSKMTNPVENLPYSAQNILGFGLFTGGQTNPDQYGNAGFVENEKALPVMFDFSNGKVVRYVLGGLNEGNVDEQVRQVLIQSAKEVVADWNNTLKYAFRGTELAREGNYVELLVEGVDIKKGELGDLDRNYIWNYMDPYDSSVLGLAQSAQNPITGRIESANVLMYPGNTIAYIGYRKRLKEISADYENFKRKAVTEQAQGKAEPEKLPAGCGEKCSEVNEAEIEEFRSIVSLTGKTARQSTQKLKALSRGQVVMSARPTTTLAIQKRNKAIAKVTSDLFLGRALDKVIQQNALSNPRALEAIVSNEILAAAKSGEIQNLSPMDLKVLNFEAKKAALSLAFAKQVEAQGGCLYEAHLSAGNLALGKDENFVKALKNSYKWTLAHEMGHVFGLTHNFIASFDKANFKFAGEKETNRQYSSVMDYIDDSITAYAGLGPYDAHAVRAGYTGRIELTDGKFVTLNQLKDLLKLDSWWKLDRLDLSGAPFKKYLYCNDYEAGQDPACQRHDRGTTYNELVTNKIADYNEMYPWKNYRGDRVQYGNPSAYIANLISTMTDIRKMNEETLYHVMTDRNYIEDLACAQRKAKNFFLGVLGTPTTYKSFNDPSRFSSVEMEVPKFDATGCNAERGADGNVAMVKKNVIIEAKALEDLRLAGSTQIETRGIQFDKAVASMMLTRRDLGISRYSSKNIEFSFADFDRVFYGGDDVDSNLTLKVLTESLSDRPMAIYADGLFIDQLGSDFEVTTNSLTRSYTLLSSAVFTESDSNQGPSNLATHFRVGSTRAIGNRLAVGLSSLKLDDQDQVKFYALSNATAAKDLVETAAARRLLIDNKDALLPVLKEAVTMVQTVSQEKDQEKIKAAVKETTDKIAAKIKELDKDSLLIPKNMRERGLTEEALAGVSIETIAKTLQIVEGVAKILNNDNAAQLGQQLRSIGAENTSLIKSYLPILGLLGEAIETTAYPEQQGADKTAASNRETRVTLLGVLLPQGILTQQHDMIVENLSQLNEFFNMLHPELNKN